MAEAARPRYSRVSSGDAGVSESLGKLRDQFDTFYNYRAVLKESYGHVASCFQLLEDEEDCEGLKAKFREVTGAVDGIIKKDPILLIGGQVNCGKSSFINLLLNRRVVPENEHPCTARIVRIKYSAEEYYQLTDVNGSARGGRLPLEDRKTKKELWKEIELGEAGRERIATVEDVVEIGINHPLLETGLQIIDTPGLSENRALDSVVNQCLDGVLQVLFYVIDGNTSWRNQDYQFMSEILTRSPDIKIIYVCNKCEEDAQAKEMDASDDSDEDVQQPIPKGHIVHSKLLNSCLLTENEGISCNRFFQISCKILKRQSSSQSDEGVTEPDEFSREYQRLILSLCSILRHFLYHSLRLAVQNVLGVVARCHEVCRRHERGEKEAGVTALLEKFEETNVELVAAVLKHQDQLRDALAVCIMEKVDEAVEASVNKTSLLDAIILLVTKEGFYPVFSALATLWGKMTEDENVNTVVASISNEIQAISKNFAEEFDGTSVGGETVALLKKINDDIQELQLKEGVHKDMHEYILKCLNRMVENEMHNGTSVSADQIRAAVDPAEMSEQICTNISQALSALGLLPTVLFQLTELLRKAEDDRPFSKEVRRSFPAENMVLASLLSSIKHKEVTILGTGGAGRHCIVYKGKRGNMVCAARSTIGDTNCKDFQLMAETYIQFRDLKNDHLNILRPFDVGRDCTKRVLILTPYIETNMFQELVTEGSVLRQCDVEDRLNVALQIVKGCVFLKEMGLEALDLRPNNIRLHDGCPKIDISKWRRIDAPYPPPDSMPPFHFPPECVEDNISRHPAVADSYSCAILTWMLACGRFVRPPFAGEDGHATDPLNLPRFGHELKNIFRRICTTEQQNAFVPLLDHVLEKCIVNEAERIDIAELEKILEAHIAVMV